MGESTIYNLLKKFDNGELIIKEDKRTRVSKRYS